MTLSASSGTLAKSFLGNRSVPQWDLSLVLLNLLKTPYEPLKEATVKNVTLKTIFLLALASAKRVSELKGLSDVVSHAHRWTKLVLSFVPEFVAKTQLPGTSLDPIEIPAMSQILGDEDEDILLCPVRALPISGLL